MRTEKQIEASRLNGAKSRGPVTAEGKLASSQNSLKHGVLSSKILLKDENPEAFDALATELYEEFQPATAFERSLIDDMISARWRSERTATIERANLDIQIDAEYERRPEEKDPEKLTAHGFRSLAAETRTLDLIARYQASLSRQYLRAHKRFIEVRAARLKSDPDQPSPAKHVIPIDSAKRTQAEAPPPVEITPDEHGEVVSAKRTRRFEPRRAPLALHRSGLGHPLSRRNRRSRSQRRKISPTPLAPAA